MASATSASGLVKPNAIRVRTRVFVFRRFDQAVGQAMLEGRIDGLAVSDDPLLQFDERRDATSAGPADPPVQGLDCGFVGHSEDRSQTFLEQVRAI